MSTTHNIYRDNGFATRLDYLKSIAEDYDLPLDRVKEYAAQLGPDEDFDGLITMVNDESEYNMMCWIEEI